MIYNNLIYLLVVILILSTSSVPDSPQIPPPLAVLIFLVKGLLYQQLVHRIHGRDRIQLASQYFAAEQKLSIMAIILIATDVCLLDFKYYMSQLPLTSKLPVLVNFGGLSLFFGYLAIMWSHARKSYHAVFGRMYNRRSFLLNNVKINLPIILPWLFLSLLANLLELSPIPWLKDFMASPWGEPLFFVFFVLILVLTFPAIIIRLWNCSPLPAGDIRTRIEKFCRKERLEYAEIMSWPLFEGQMLTAGVMGLVKRFRYLLITPAMLNAMTPEEIEAVMAHEIGHVKKHHLQLYFLFFVGFGLLAQVSAYPLLYVLLNSDFFYKMSLFTNKEPASALAFMTTIPMFVLMIVYFRYVLGFFMRNFERQADLHVFETMPDSRPLISVLEKIAWLNGNIRDLPSWHHFSIGQRVDFLQKCQEYPSLIRKHNRKVYSMLSLYLLTVAVTGFLLWKMPTNLLEGAATEKFTAAVIKHKIKEDPQNHLWHQLMGDLQYEKKLYPQAIASYETALGLEPDNSEVLNNLAWLLLTAEGKEFLDPVRALSLAKRAVKLRPLGHILDTLATAYWMNGFNEIAVMTERQAMARDPANRKYYRNQMERFATYKRLLPTE